MRSLTRAALATLAIASTTTFAYELMEPTPMPELDYQGTLLTGNYDPAIPTPESILGFPVGQMTATPEQIVEAVNTWADASPRAMAVEYARSHEGRPLYYVAISTPENLARLDEIKSDIQRLADPEGLSSAEADQIIDALPGTAWMAYSIHGNESSGADAALAAIYHLVASTDDEIQQLLESQVIFIDPSQNPDGRARFTRELTQHRGVAPNVDNQSMLHQGSWPRGRTNHYFFDLNRDFFYLVHPETRGRVAAINDWYPQIIIDGHEMGSQSSYLFSPAREPINKHLSPALRQWSDVFASDQGGAFDEFAWPYYTGEWNDNFYSGYSSYAMFRGSLFILYEQASIDEDGIRQADGNILTYREAVHHQLVSTMANLESLSNNSKEMYRTFYEDRRQAISADSPYANISYAVLPTANHYRWNRFIDRMQAQGFRLYTLDRDTTFRHSTDLAGKKATTRTLPAGTLIIPNRQPDARLLATMMEFDAQVSEQALEAERRELLRDGGGTMYDVTAWNLEMMYGLDTVMIPQHIEGGISPYQAPEAPSALEGADNAIAWTVDGRDDASVTFAARLLEQDVQVRLVDKDTTLGGREIARGSVWVSRYDNRGSALDLEQLIAAAASDAGVTAVGVTAGLGQGDLPDAGGRHFQLLEKPQLAMMSRGGISAYSFGAIWHHIDSRLGIRHSHLNEATFNFSDLRRYNVLVLPDRWYGSLSESAMSSIAEWVDNGGTLIAIGGSVGQLINAENGMSSVRGIRDSFAEADAYDVSLQREWMARQPGFGDMAALTSYTVPGEVMYPFPAKESAINEEQAKKRDAWQSIFMPQGAFLAGSVDTRHWLSAGTGETLPILFGGGQVLMSNDRSEAVVRLGMLEDSAEAKEARRLGWATIPAGKDVRLRMSGLLWPEAAQRLANAAYLTREAKGNGQIILFADAPVFRGSTLGTSRLLLNAIIYGPGLGASHPVKP